MNIPLRYLVPSAALALVLSYGSGFYMGWYAKGESVAAEEVQKKAKADEALKEPEQKAADDKAKADVVYKTLS